MILQDDRTPEQKNTHDWLIVGTDSFMSGWGKAENGVSYAAWACREEDKGEVMAWVEKRGEMKRVREVYGSYKPSGHGHCHIYVVNENHPSVARLYEFRAECATA